MNAWKMNAWDTKQFAMTLTMIQNGSKMEEMHQNEIQTRIKKRKTNLLLL